MLRFSAYGYELHDQSLYTQSQSTTLDRANGRDSKMILPRRKCGENLRPKKKKKIKKPSGTRPTKVYTATARQRVFSRVTRGNSRRSVLTARARTAAARRTHTQQPGVARGIAVAAAAFRISSRSVMAPNGVRGGRTAANGKRFLKKVGEKPEKRSSRRFPRDRGRTRRVVTAGVRGRRSKKPSRAPSSRTNVFHVDYRCRRRRELQQLIKRVVGEGISLARATGHTARRQLRCHWSVSVRTVYTRLRRLITRFFPSRCFFFFPDL